MNDFKKPDFLMFDYETVSSNPLEAAVVSFGAIIGYWDDIDTNDYAGTIERLNNQSLYHNIDPKKQISHYGLRASEDTLAWWDKQDGFAQEIFKDKNKISVEEHCEEFRQYCIDMNIHNHTVTYIRAPQFDHTICDNVHQKVVYPLPYNSWKVRDVRTAVDFAFDQYNGYIPGFREEMESHNLTKHYAVHDVIMDLIQLKHCREALGLS